MYTVTNVEMYYTRVCDGFLACGKLFTVSLAGSVGACWKHWTSQAPGINQGHAWQAASAYVGEEQWGAKVLIHSCTYRHLIDCLTFHRCVVCMCSYEAKERVRFLPCTHNYHQDCIDQWFKVCQNCISFYSTCYVYIVCSMCHMCMLYVGGLSYCI